MGDFLQNHLIESLMILSGILTSIAVMKHQGNNTEKKIDKMSDRMEIRDNKMDTRMDNFQNTLHAVELKQASMDANIANIIANIEKEIKRQDEKSH